MRAQINLNSTCSRAMDMLAPGLVHFVGQLEELQLSTVLFLDCLRKWAAQIRCDQLLQKTPRTVLLCFLGDLSAGLAGSYSLPVRDKLVKHNEPVAQSDHLSTETVEDVVQRVIPPECSKKEFVRIFRIWNSDNSGDIFTHARPHTLILWFLWGILSGEGRLFTSIEYGVYADFTRLFTWEAYGPYPDFRKEAYNILERVEVDWVPVTIPATVPRSWIGCLSDNEEEDEEEEEEDSDTGSESPETFTDDDGNVHLMEDGGRDLKFHRNSEDGAQWSSVAMLTAGWIPPGKRHTWTRPHTRPRFRSEKWRKANGWQQDENTKLYTVLPKKCLSKDALEFIRNNEGNAKMGCNKDFDVLMREDEAKGVGCKRKRKEK